MTLEEAKQQGFTRVNFPRSQAVSNEELMTMAHKLDWPFEQPYHEGFLGNAYNEYQPYGPAGYHAGSDMVLESDSWLVAPFSGKLEAGTYTYTDYPNGSRIKHWKPWPSTHRTSFELGVIDERGYRFEFHHINPKSLPEDIISALNAGDAKVVKGQRLGRVQAWSTMFHYDHVHVNVYGPDNKEYNPEHFFKLIPDTTAPQTQIITDHQGLKENFIVVGGDKKDNSVFNQAPAFMRLSFENGGETIVNFKLRFWKEDGSFKDINDHFLPSYVTKEGAVVGQAPGFYPVSNLNFMKIDLPSDKGNGRYTLKVEDMAGNAQVFQGVHE